MNTFLHLDLLKNEERFSSSPVRLWAMMPLFSVLAALGLMLWWSLCAAVIHNQIALKADLEKEIANMKPAHNALLALRAQESDITAVTRQISLYQNARIPFGETLAKLAQSVPDNMQITEMRVPLPLPVAMDPKNPTLGPTNIFESVSLRFAGRITGERSSEAVNALLTALRTSAFTNLIRSAEIPKGAFRQDVNKSSEAVETLLFELTCDCVPRRFE